MRSLLDRAGERPYYWAGWRHASGSPWSGKWKTRYRHRLWICLWLPLFKAWYCITDTPLLAIIAAILPPKGGFTGAHSLSSRHTHTHLNPCVSFLSNTRFHCGGVLKLWFQSSVQCHVYIDLHLFSLINEREINSFQSVSSRFVVRTVVLPLLAFYTQQQKHRIDKFIALYNNSLFYWSIYWFTLSYKSFSINALPGYKVQEKEEKPKPKPKSKKNKFGDGHFV